MDVDETVTCWTEREMEFEGRLQQIQAETDALRRQLNAAEMKSKDEAARPVSSGSHDTRLICGFYLLCNLC